MGCLGCLAVELVVVDVVVGAGVMDCLVFVVLVHDMYPALIVLARRVSLAMSRTI